MLYTASVDRILFWLVIPMLLLSYALFRQVESQNISDGGRLSIANEHLINISSNSEINCLILGGSNSFFSLSAEQISDQAGFNCYNLSLLNEGYSFFAFWDFVESIPFDKNNIKTVFYSGILPIQDDRHYYSKIKNAESGIGITGEQEFRWHGRSIASYLITAFRGEGFFEESYSYPLPNKYGDFDFSNFERCDYEKPFSEFDTFYWRDIQLLVAWVHFQLNEMKSLFSESDIYFLVPSVYSKEEPFDVDNKALKAVEYAVLNFDNSPNKTMFIAQPVYKDTSVLCDAPHHANSVGREKRTRNLIDYFCKYCTG